MARKICVLAGASLCAIRQNVKLTVSGVKLYDLTEKQVKACKSCFSKVIYSERSVSCFWRERL
jgi:hypothetical protein